MDKPKETTTFTATIRTTKMAGTMAIRVVNDSL